MSTITLLSSAFIVSIVALTLFVASQGMGTPTLDADAARVIFARGEEGGVEEPSITALDRERLQTALGKKPDRHSTVSDQALLERAMADASTAPVVLMFFWSALFWLLLASVAGLVASIKLHAPDWLVSEAWQTFGRVRTMHLNAVAYGWAPMAGLGIAMFVIPRLLGTRLVGGPYAMAGGMIWNGALGCGIVCIALGYNDGMEWLEIPWQLGVLIAFGGALIGIPLVLTLLARKVDHLYVSVWYMGCALFWFPVLYGVAKIPGLHTGIEQATMNWWFGHNVLGLFYTPLALASVYYFLPKVLGRPIQSYNLSLLGFWGLAFFYGQVGGHHLIGGPVPGWLVTLSIVQSLMMILPVAAFTINQYLTLRGNLSALIYSPTLRFISVGGLLYTASSLQGSLEALRSINVITHFTHFTVAHAHLGLYGFVTMVFFGSIYFIVPRVTGREWPYPALISWHFWLSVTGFAIYFTALTWGGWLQGLAMLDETRPFMESVELTRPFLEARTVGGSLMGTAHLVFAIHFACVLFGWGPKRRGAAVLGAPLVGRLT